jgi:hypothetical protein
MNRRTFQRNQTDRELAVVISALVFGTIALGIIAGLLQ